MKPEEVLIAMLLLTLTISGTYIITTQDGGFFDAYDYTAPSNYIETKYNKLSEINSTFGDMTKAYEDDKPSALDYLNRLLMGASAVLETIYETVTMPVQLLGDLAVDLGVPVIIVNIATVALVIVFFMSIIYLIFRMTN